MISLGAALLVGTTIVLRQIDASILAHEPNATRPPLMLIAAVALVLTIIGVALNLDLASARAEWVGSAWFRLSFCALFLGIAIYSLMFVNGSGGGFDIQRINGVLVEYNHGAIGRNLTEEEAANSLRAFGQLGVGLTAWISLLAVLLAPIGFEILRERLKQRDIKTGSKDERSTP